MMQRLIYILTFVATLTLSSCETDSDIELNEVNNYVLTALVYPDSVVNVYAYKSVSYDSKVDYVPIANAYVAMSINDVVVDTLSLLSNNYRITFAQHNIASGDKVRISVVDNSQKQLCSATTTMLAPLPISDVSYSVQTSDTDTLQNITISFSEPAETIDYYQIKARLHEQLSDGTEIIRPLECDFYDYLFYIAKSTLNITNTSMPDGIFTDELTNGRNTRISFNIAQRNLVPTQNNSELTLEILLYRHTYDYYNFLLTSYMVREYLILPVFGVSSVYSNVENGVGIVSGMAVSTYKLNL